jgi:glycosyl transferase family 25
MIPVYVINLARSLDRRAWMERQLAEAGVAARFVAAVDGRRCRRNAQEAPGGPRLSKVETALILSHRKAWRALLASPAAVAVVLEDDVRLGRGLAEILALDWPSRGCELVKLETMFDKVWLSRAGQAMGARSLHRLGAEHHGSAAYLISRTGALKMLRATRGLREPVDVTMFGRAAIFGGLVEAWQLTPAIAVQQHLLAGSGEPGFASTLQADRAATPHRELSLPQRLRREAWRVVAQTVRVARLAPTMSRRRVEFE